MNSIFSSYKKSPRGYEKNLLKYAKEFPVLDVRNKVSCSWEMPVWPWVVISKSFSLRKRKDLVLCIRSRLQTFPFPSQFRIQCFQTGTFSSQRCIFWLFLERIEYLVVYKKSGNTEGSMKKIKAMENGARLLPWSCKNFWNLRRIATVLQGLEDNITTSLLYGHWSTRN